MSKRLHVKYSPFLSDFNKTNFFDTFSRKAQIISITKISPEGADGQRDMPKLIVAFRNFAKARKKSFDIKIK
jgi:hypothetical protein